MTRFAHDMPWGAQFQEDGAVRFRLWAPGQERLSLVLENEQRILPMERQEDGWYQLVTSEAGPGTRYRYELQDGFRVPDPVSRLQPDDVHGPSEVLDPRAYEWRNPGWRGRPWEEVVLYELHTGTFSPEGTYDGIRRHLDHLLSLGVTAFELMPLADFPGKRNWGYDGVYHYAPDFAYGRQDAVKRLVDEAHDRELMIFLDVVYNHFGPQGNYLSLYAPTFFTDRHHTPWGSAIDFRHRAVRDYFVNNAVFWLEEYRFDGLRFDAVDWIVDDSDKHILDEIVETVRSRIGPDRHVHLNLENYDNNARLLEGTESKPPRLYNAQWNDDFHHVAHVLLTGENVGYYRDYQGDSVERLHRSLTSGFVYQGERSSWKPDKARGQKSDHLRPTCFVNFLQNHDQVGNRPFSDRAAAMARQDGLRCMIAIVLLSPHVPMIFMGEEYGSTAPFYFFVDFDEELGSLVREGRRKEFGDFVGFSDERLRELIPDPNDPTTFDLSRLPWPSVRDALSNFYFLYYQDLLALRRRHVIPQLASLAAGAVESARFAGTGLDIAWRFASGERWRLVANVGHGLIDSAPKPTGELMFETHKRLADDLDQGSMPPWSAAWFLVPADRA